MENEKRLIKMCDATAVYNGIVLYMAENAYLNDTALDVLKMVAGWLNDAPTVDAVEVVHGRWAKQVEDDCYWYECSECAGAVPRTRWGHDWYSDYCPNCGAKMDGDGNG